MKRLIIKISGTVQGVFFREYTKRKAIELGIVGLVQNCDDGTVVVTSEGEEKILKALLKWAKRGPELAKVEKVDIIWEEPSGKFCDFQVE